MKNVLEEMFKPYNEIDSALLYTADAQINKGKSVDYICTEAYRCLLSASLYINELIKDAEEQMNNEQDRFEEIKDIDLPFGEENTTAEDLLSSAIEEDEDVTD